MCVPEVQEKIPQGNYTFVGLDIDTTGRRLIDEVRISSDPLFLYFSRPE